MNKSEKVRRIYAIVLSVLIVATSIALICVAADIYYSGKGTDVIYSPAIVADRLKKLAIPLMIVIAAIIAGALFPLYETKAKRLSEETLRKLQRRMPKEGEGEEFAAAQTAYRKMKITKIAVWCSGIAVALAGSVIVLVYLCIAEHFTGTDFTALVTHILNLVKVAMPCTVVALGVLIAASYVNGYCSKKQVEAIKTMIRFGSKEVELPSELKVLDKVNKVASHDITLWVVRGVVFALAVTFIILGILNGGARDVLVKAINICTECIGIG